MKYVLGIDAAWSVKNPSGVALLKCSSNEKPELVRVGRSYEEFLDGFIDWSMKVKGSIPDFSKIMSFCPPVAVIALDIPLAPFHIKGRREVDQALSREYGRYKAAVHSPTKDRPGPLAVEIFNQLIFHGFKWATEYIPDEAFFEVYPHASIIEIFNYSERFPYKVGKKRTYWPDASNQERTNNLIGNLNEIRNNLAELIDLKQFLPPIEEHVKFSNLCLKGYEDVLDALVCALTGYYYLRGQIRPFGDSEGVAWVPAVR